MDETIPLIVYLIIILGGFLLIDRFWYKNDSKKNDLNSRATHINGRALHGDVVLANVDFIDEDEHGRPLDQVPFK
jgi:hypothetical protein